MNLKQYLDDEGLMIKGLAKKLIIAPSYLSSIIHGKKKPSLRLAMQIEQKTNGKVTAQEIMDAKLQDEDLI